MYNICIRHMIIFINFIAVNVVVFTIFIELKRTRADIPIIIYLHYYYYCIILPPALHVAVIPVYLLIFNILLLLISILLKQSFYVQYT